VRGRPPHPLRHGRIGCVTIEYESSPAHVPTRQDQIYTTVLGVFAFFLLLAIGSLRSMANNPSTSEQGRVVMRLSAYVAACYAIASAVVLVVRIWFPAQRRWVTLGLNVVLLAYVPFGTAVGAYGLLRVDKRLRQTDSA
jgi:hypothetical protein